MARTTTGAAATAHPLALPAVLLGALLLLCTALGVASKLLPDSSLGTARIRAKVEDGTPRAKVTLWYRSDRAPISGGAAGYQVRAGQSVRVLEAGDPSAGSAQMLRVATDDEDLGWIAAMHLEGWRPAK